jgi:O-antigen/teichoic acid export membrane protein
MIRKIFRNNHDAWVATNLTTRVATRLITMGLIVRYLTVPEVATWYIFAALFGLVSLAEAGLGRVVTRQVSERFKANINSKYKHSDLRFLSIILKSYSILVFALCLIAFIFGVWWFESSNVPWLNTAWMFFVIANGISLYAALNTAMLQGLGEVGLSQKNETISSLINVVVFICFILAHISLLVPTIALVASTTVSGYLNHKSLRRVVSGLSCFKLDFNSRYIRAVLARIGPELGKYFLMLFAFHLLTSVFILMLDYYQSPNVVAAYGITMQMITLILTFSNIWLTSSFPAMAAQKRNNNKTILKSLFYSVIYRSMSVLILGMVIVLTIGNPILSLIGSQVLLLPIEILQIVIVVIAVEYFIFTLIGQLLVSQSRMKFTYYSAIGALFISLSALFLLEFGYGITEMFQARIVIFLVIIAVPIVIDVKNIFNIKKISPL